MPKYEVHYGVIDWYSGVVEADNEEHLRDMLDYGDVYIKCHSSELYDGYDITEIDNA